MSRFSITWTNGLFSFFQFSQVHFFFQAFYPEVKKMLFGDYGNNNDQENCLLKKMKIHVTLDLALASKKYKKRMLEGE